MAHFLKLQNLSIQLALTLLLNIQLLANSERLYLLMGDAYMLAITMFGLVSLILFTRLIITRIRHFTMEPIPVRVMAPLFGAVHLCLDTNRPRPW